MTSREKQELERLAQKFEEYAEFAEKVEGRLDDCSDEERVQYSATMWCSRGSAYAFGESAKMLRSRLEALSKEAPSPPTEPIPLDDARL